MATQDYSKMKNAELESLLKSRGLTHTGKKADLIARLKESDDAAPQTSAPAPAAAADEIDWDDEPATETAKSATSAPAAAALEAGGKGPIDTPVAVPNQVIDTDPSTTSDLKVGAAPTTSTAPAETLESAPATAEEPPKPAVDFTSGIDTVKVDEEIERRRKRAIKFGLNPDEDEGIKTLERQKKFGTTEIAGGLNEALPERRERAPKRAREDGAEVNRGGKRGRPDAGPRRGSERRQPNGRSGTPKGVNGRGDKGFSEADRKAAEARKAKFATAT